MRYYILKKENNIDSIVGFINLKNDLIRKLKSKYPDSIHVPKTIDELKNDSGSENGIYVLPIENGFQIVKKYTYNSAGYIYNSNYPEVKMVSSWTLLPYEFDIQFNSDNMLENIVDHSPQYDFNDLPEYPGIYIIGARNSGKRIISYDIINYYNKNKENNVLIMTNYFTSMYYKEEYPDAQIEEGFNYEALTQFMEYQKERNQNGQNKPGLVIIDVALRSDQMEKENMLKLINNHKEYKTIFVLIVQYPIQLGEKLKSKIDLIMLTSEEYEINQKKLFECFGKQFQSLSMFKEVFGKLTENKSALVLDNSKKCKNIYQTVYKYTPSCVNNE